MSSFNLFEVAGGTLVAQEDIVASDVAVEASFTDIFLCLTLKHLNLSLLYVLGLIRP